MLRVENLQVKYGHFTAVFSASLEVPEGKIISLIGANGAGKTSLLSAVAKLLTPSEGKVFFRGEDITQLPADQIVRRGLCLVPQGGRVFQRLSVKDNLTIGSYPKEARKHYAESLEQVFQLFPVLYEKREAQAGTLSGGQRQMLAIGRALMSRPSCIMFDEISLGLAPLAIRDLYTCIRKINREQRTSIILVEQDTERALKISDYCYVMMKGNISLSGKTDDFTDEQIRKAYFGI